ncbi:Protein SRC2 [Bienertia sinuspersici]
MKSPAPLPPQSPSPNTHLLEINLISAQNLKPPSTNLRKLQTYAVAYIHPSLKLRTRVDRLSAENPTWNDKFIFRVSSDFLSSETSSFTVDIFSVGVLKDALLGSVRLLLSNFLSPLSTCVPSFIAVQVRRPSGRFHGVLNVGAMLIDASSEVGSSLSGVSSAIGYHDFMGKSRRRKHLHRRGVSDFSSGSESCGGDSFDFSDGTESTASNSSSTSVSNLVLKDLNGRRKDGDDEVDDDDGMIMCGLGFQKKLNISSSDKEDIKSFDEGKI